MTESSPVKNKAQRLVEANVMGIVTWNLEGAVTGANEAFLHMMRYDREDLASDGLRLADLTPVEWRGHDERAIAELKATGIFRPYEKEYFRRDGSRVPALLGGALLEGDGNEGVAFVLDLSEQKQHDSSRLYSEEKYRLLVETASDAIVSIDDKGIIVFANPAIATVFGYDPTELTGKPLTLLMPEYMRELHKIGLTRYLATGRRHINWQGTELTALRKDGEEFPVEVSFGELTRDHHKIFTGFLRDISKRKQAEIALRAAMDERTRISAFREEIGIALSHQEDLKGILHSCAGAIVRQSIRSALQEESALQKLILIVDDDESVRRTTRLLIESYGFRAEVFESAEEFLKSGELNGASCLIVDVQMPGMDGLQLQTRLAAIGRSIPIIFITAYDSKESRRRAMQAGAVAFLGKPFSDEQLLQTIRSALEIARGS